MALNRFLEAGRTEVGTDEAGRGCLAGPVVAAAVILPEGFNNEILNDSKQISEKKRYALRPIIEASALAYGIGFVTAQEIDEINILNASFLAMHRAIDQLKIDFDHILVDGNRFKAYPNKPHTCIVKGDAKFQSIAAASILAKTYRDDYMLKIAQEFPYYEWNRNKGYPTKAHVDSILKNGTCHHHRKSYHIKAY
ncbi:MAG: ribonuclease HII [Bacteroidales bacterium]|nr:ribonuclease HII [Bacteroidales bacterium]